MWCGDGACNGTENQSNCCKDCGCPGQLVCNGNTCEAPCATEAFDLYNEWPNEPFYSVGCGYTLTEFSGLLVCNSSSCVWAPSGGYDIATLSWGTTETLTYQCCLYDGVACNDYTHNGTCTINGQQVACNCSAPASITLTANACQTVSTTLCTP